MKSDIDTRETGDADSKSLSKIPTTRRFMFIDQCSQNCTPMAVK